MISHFLEKFHLKDKILKYQKISHRDSLSSDVFKIDLKKDKKVILKVFFKEEKWKREIYFLKLLKDFIKVPRIFEITPSEKDQKPAVLMEFLEGEVIFLENLDSEISFKLGELLAVLHNFPAKKYEDIAKKTKNPINGKKLFEKSFQEHFLECKNHLSKDLLKKIEDFYTLNIEKLENVDGPCVVHRDFRPGNVLVKESSIVGLIDFENSLFNFAEEDFSQMEHLVWEKYPKTKEFFLKGYKNIRKLPDFERILPLLRINRALGSIGFTIERNTLKTSHKFVFEENLKFLNNFFYNKS
jgi:Ser/Thr protein kinase RdoA (MazF antagonist)